MFHVRRRPADSQPRRRKKKPLGASNGANSISSDREGAVLVEVTHSGDGGRRIKLGNDPIEVGSANTNSLQLFGPSIQARHCLISLLEGVCTVTPLHTDALTFVNGHHITQPTILHNGSVVMFGRVASYRFVDSPTDGRYNLALSQSQLDSACLYESRSPTSPGSWNDEDGLLNSVHKNDSAGTTSNNSGNVGGGVSVTDQSLSTRDQDDNKQRSGDHHSHAGSSAFDGQSIEGNLENETKSISSLKSGGSNSQERSPKIASGMENQGQEAILPAVLEFPETHQELFLRHIISELDVNAPHFKLAPVYSLYLCARYRASTHYRPELQPTERAHKLTIFLHHVANLIYTVVQEQYSDPRILAFWMANSSEFLHFLKSDRHISAFSVQAQEVLAESVQTAFRNLVNCFRMELSQTLNQFLSETIDHDSAAGLVLTVLGSAMALLRRCRVNAALTIQLFSQLFHYINVICFNTIVANSHMCTAEWGKVMSERLQLLELWAERQGLELAADCHLAKINQCAQFLQAPKSSVEEIQQLACSCFRLNSLQMSALLQQEKIPRNLVDTAIRMAESVADELTRSDGREVRLEESPELHLALLLPDDGFSCDVVRGIPSGLVDFLNPLQQQGMCRLAAQPTSIGLWTVYMHQFNARSSSAMSNKLPQPEVQVIKLHKNANGMGLSIVAAKGAGQERLGIYIKSVVPGGAADADGRLQAGDQLLRVDGQSLIGITQEKAADYLVRTGPVVTLEVAKQGAIYHGLATLLQQPSPVIARESEPLPNISSAVHRDQRRHSMYNNGYFASASDDSLNRGRRESLGYLHSSSPPVRRLSASSLQEVLCARGHQLHIDPRYRDTRPIARSVSSLYLSNENNLNNVQNNNNYFHTSPVRQRTNSTLNTSTPPPSIYIEEYTDPEPSPNNLHQRSSNDSFTNLSYTEAHQPLNEDGIASVADSDDIPFIDDGSPTEDVQVYVPSQKEPPQSQLLKRIEHVVKPQPPGIISNVRRNTPGYRKTVSFDLEENKLRRRDSISLDRGTGINRKFHTHDAISKFSRVGFDSSRSSTESLDKNERERIPLIQKIRRELNSNRSTSGNIASGNNSGSGSNSNRSSNESIEKITLINKQTRDLNINTASNATTIQRPKRELNAIRATSGGGLSGNQQRGRQTERSVPIQNPTNFVNITNTSVSKPVSASRTTVSDSYVRTGGNPSATATTNTVVTIKVPSVYEIESSSETVHNYYPQRSLSHANINFPHNPTHTELGTPTPPSCHVHTTTLTLSQCQSNQSNKDDNEHSHQFSKPFGEGKVREMAEFFERNKSFDACSSRGDVGSGMSSKFSKSASYLYPTKEATSPRKTKKLSQQEQLDILEQLKEWSLHGTSGKDYKIHLQNSNSQNAFTNETQQRINETLKNKYDTHNISNSNAPSNVNTAHKLITPIPKLSVSTTVTCDCPCCANCKKEIVTNILEPNETTQENAKSSVGPTTPSFKCYDSCHKITQNQLKRQNSVMSTAKGNTVRAVKRNQKQQRNSEDCKYPSVLAKESEKTTSSSTITRCHVRPYSTSVPNDELTENDDDGIAYESNRRMSERDLTRMSGTESKTVGPLIPNNNLSNSKSVPALHHHTGSGTISMNVSKSRSTHSLTTNPNTSNNITGGVNSLNNNEQGFYQNLSVYRAQNQSQPILTQRPVMSLHSAINTHTGNSHNGANPILTPTNGTSSMHHPVFTSQQQQQLHHLSMTSPTGSNNMPPTRPASAYYHNSANPSNSDLTSASNNQLQQHLATHQPQQQFMHHTHNISASSTNLNSGSMSAATLQQYQQQQQQQLLSQMAPHSSLTMGNRSRSTQNFNRDMQNQHSLRIQQIMAPSMPNISGIYQQQHMSASQSMQNVNMSGIDPTTPYQNGAVGDGYMQQPQPQQHSPATQTLRRNPRHELLSQGGSDGAQHLSNVMQQQQQQNFVSLPPKPGNMQQVSPTKQPQQAQQLPPTAPKPQPNRMQQQQYIQQQQQQQQQQQAQQQQQQNALYQQSVEDKPPLPPTATHPLFKPSQQITPGMNYVASSIDPPKGGYMPISSVAALQNQKNFIGTNPWEREEREKEVEMRREHIRQWREQQIAELSSLVQRTTQQEEQLKTLILERDFERRALEVEEHEDESEPSYEKESVQEALRQQTSSMQIPLLNFRQTEVKTASMLDNGGGGNNSSAGSVEASPLSSARNSAAGGFDLAPGQQQQQQQQPPPLPNNPPPTTGPVATTIMQPKSILKNNRYDSGTGTAPSSPSKSQKSTSFADDRHLQTEHPISSLTKDISQMSINSLASTEGLSPPHDATTDNSTVPPPPPPERNSSYLIMSQQKVRNSSIGLLKTATSNSADLLNQNQNLAKKANMLNNNGIINNNNNSANSPTSIASANTATINSNNMPQMSTMELSQSGYVNNMLLRDNKRVSFHDEENNYMSSAQLYGTSSTSGLTFDMYATNADSQMPLDLDAILEDRNHRARMFDNTVLETMPTSPDSVLWNTTVQSTPGVIGAQEVYRDPRQRRLAEKQQQQQQRNTEAVPEKLSFKEKMKMFALESGEDNTPKDKLKISRAQRDIDAVH